MEDAADMCNLGAFSPSDGRKLALLLEEMSISFEVNVDQTRKAPPNYHGFSSGGAEVVFSVPISKLEAAREVVARLYPL